MPRNCARMTVGTFYPPLAIPRPSIFRIFSETYYSHILTPKRISLKVDNQNALYSILALYKYNQLTVKVRKKPRRLIRGCQVANVRF